MNADDVTSDALQALMPLCDLLGVEVDSASTGEVRLAMAWRAELCTSAGVLHGGAIMALADSAGATCAVLNLPPGAGTATIESKTNFFRAVRDGRAVATSRALHVGSSTIVIETEVRDAGDRLVAKVTQTQAVLKG
jgi:uncharacterized protein (TIGR00369 family)